MRNAWAVMTLAVLGVAGVAQAGEQGVSQGNVAFGGFKWDTRNIKPGITILNGTWLGVSISDAKKGILHNASWSCDGEVVIADNVVLKADGYCQLTDPDGDTVSLLWERTDIPGSGNELKTKGTYFAGTGKYTGIKGNYFLACRLGGLQCSATGGDYKVP